MSTLCLVNVWNLKIDCLKCWLQNLYFIHLLFQILLRVLKVMRCHRSPLQQHACSQHRGFYQTSRLQTPRFRKLRRKFPSRTSAASLGKSASGWRLWRHQQTWSRGCSSFHLQTEVQARQLCCLPVGVARPFPQVSSLHWVCCGNSIPFV